MIVDNPDVGPSTPRWTIQTDSAILSIGESEDDSLSFTYALSAIALPDGRIAVSDDYLYRIRLFDRAGRLVGRLARNGDGPGEFRDIPDLFPATDGFAAASSSAVVWFRSSLDLNRTTTWQYHADQNLPTVLATRPDGSVVSYADVQRPLERTGKQRVPTLVNVISSAGTFSPLLESLPGREIAVSLDPKADPPVLRGNPIVFGRYAVIAANPAFLYIGTNDAFEYQQRDLNGKLLRKVRVRATPIPVTQQWKDAFAAAQWDRWSKGSAVSQNDSTVIKRLKESLAATVFGDQVPWYEQFVPTADGGLWISKTRGGPKEPRSFLIFDREGRLIATGSLPAATRPLQIWADTMLARREDDNGSPHIELYKINR